MAVGQEVVDVTYRHTLRAICRAVVEVYLLRCLVLQVLYASSVSPRLLCSLVILL